LHVRRGRPRRLPLGLAQRGPARGSAGQAPPRPRIVIRGAAALAAVVALGVSSPARALAETLTKKDRAARAKSTRHGAPPVPGAKPAKLINLHNFWTKEWLAVEAGAPPAQ